MDSAVQFLTYIKRALGTGRAASEYITTVSFSRIQSSEKQQLELVQSEKKTVRW